MSICDNCQDNNCMTRDSVEICSGNVEFCTKHKVLYDSYGHHDVAEEIASLLDQKRADYGSENIKKFGSQGVLVRVSDKVERLINLSKRTDKPNFESIEDTWKDIAGYAILALIELREGRG